MGDIIIPISVYKTVDIFGLPGQEYHEDCGGKIRHKIFCELHPNDEAPAKYSAMGVGELLIPIGPEIRDELLNRKCAFDIVGIHPLKKITEYLGTSNMLPIETYEIAPQKSQIKSIVGLQSDMLHTLFYRMKVRKVFLIAKVPLGGMERYAAILPNGRVIVLAYNEEVRQPEEWSGFINSDLSTRFDSVMSKLTDEYPQLSLQSFTMKIKEWIMSKIQPAPKSTPRTNPKKQLTKKVSA